MRHFWTYNVFSEAEQSSIMDFALLHSDSFIPAAVSTKEANYRKAFVLHDLGSIGALMQSKLNELVPIACEQLKIQNNFKRTEIQLSRSGDGCYFKKHSDNGHPIAQHRRLTFVYYFWREPKLWEGGLLRMYSGQMTAYKDFEPVNNAIVWFPSRQWHEVTTVHVLGDEIKDSRYTLNGWLG